MIRPKAEKTELHIIAIGDEQRVDYRRKTVADDKSIPAQQTTMRKPYCKQNPPSAFKK